MINSNFRTFAKAVGAKTARACDGCVKRRARWYCAADDAFLCQACDSSVHSANSLARRHERVRLKSATPPHPATTWHHGFTKKARSPRGGGLVKKTHNPAVSHEPVPELGVDEQTENHEEDQLLCRVPVFDPIAEEHRKNDAVETITGFYLPGCVNSNDNDNNVESCLNGLFPTDKELEEFAADVETLLGHGLETKSFAMEDLGLVDGSLDSRRVKVEDGEERDEAVISADTDKEYCDFSNTVAAFESFDYDSNGTFREEDDHEDKVEVVEGEDDVKERSDDCEMMKENKKKVSMLRLDYEGLIATWGGQGLPWVAGERPDFDPDDDYWPACMGTSGAESRHQQYGSGIGLLAGFADKGREARVSRYREKRRTRLFSKKIRYEVRKLNAEKRPRMKGRFVKRASFVGSTSFPLLNK